jgi:hypothetical protein
MHDIDSAATQQPNERRPSPDIELRPAPQLEHLDPATPRRGHVLGSGWAGGADDALEAIAVETERDLSREDLCTGRHEAVDSRDNAESASGAGHWRSVVGRTLEAVEAGREVVPGELPIVEIPVEVRPRLATDSSSASGIADECVDDVDEIREVSIAADEMSVLLKWDM